MTWQPVKDEGGSRFLWSSNDLAASEGSRRQSILVDFERLSLMSMQSSLAVIERLGSQRMIAAAVDSRVF